MKNNIKNQESYIKIALVTSLGIAGILTPHILWINRIVLMRSTTIMKHVLHKSSSQIIKIAKNTSKIVTFMLRKSRLLNTKLLKLFSDLPVDMNQSVLLYFTINIRVLALKILSKNQ